MSTSGLPNPNNSNNGGTSTVGVVPGSRRKMVKPKMDFAKALSIMGFSTSRTLDPSGGHDARVELNGALSRKMADIDKRKRVANKKEQKKVEDKLRDEVRTLHEAYQFLCRKYIRMQEIRATQSYDQDDFEDNDGGSTSEEPSLRPTNTQRKPKITRKASFEKTSDSEEEGNPEEFSDEDDDYYDGDGEDEEEFYDSSDQENGGKRRRRKSSGKKNSAHDEEESERKISDNLEHIAEEDEVGDPFDEERSGIRDSLKSVSLDMDIDEQNDPDEVGDGEVVEEEEDEDEVFVSKMWETIAKSIESSIDIDL